MDPAILQQLESREGKLYRILEAELAGGCKKRFNYEKLAPRIGVKSAGAVRYNVGKLMEKKLIGSEGGKLFLLSG